MMSETVHLTRGIERQRHELRMAVAVRFIEINLMVAYETRISESIQIAEWKAILSHRVREIHHKLERIGRAVQGPMPCKYGKHKGIRRPITLDRFLYTFTCPVCGTSVQNTNLGIAGRKFVAHLYRGISFQRATQLAVQGKGAWTWMDILRGAHG